MLVYIIGAGSGCADMLTEEATAALRCADIIIGARRLLACLPEGCTQNRVSTYKAEEMLAALRSARPSRAAIVYSGDTGFYSGAADILPLLKASGIEYRVLPGVSSVQLMAAELGRPWQEWRLVSAHGRQCDTIAECMQGAPVLFLTGGEQSPAAICSALDAAGLGGVPVTVGERLGTPQGRICSGEARQIARQTFDGLSVLLVEAISMPERRCAGIPDNEFCRGEVPMTKQEVRAVALAKLGVRESDLLWDIGAGTGSVSVELALAARRGRVYAVECEAAACELIRQNRAKFRAFNLEITQGRAPQALEALPKPDAVFIGGTKGGMESIIELVLAKNPAARICAAAITLENLHKAVEALAAHGIEAGVTQLAAAHTRRGGGLHMLVANNPIFIITGNCQ